MHLNRSVSGGQLYNSSGLLVPICYPIATYLSSGEVLWWVRIDPLGDYIWALVLEGVNIAGRTPSYEMLHVFFFTVWWDFLDSKPRKINTRSPLLMVKASFQTNNSLKFLQALKFSAVTSLLLRGVSTYFIVVVAPSLIGLEL